MEIARDLAQDLTQSIAGKTPWPLTVAVLSKTTDPKTNKTASNKVVVSVVAIDIAALHCLDKTNGYTHQPVR